MPGHPAFVPPRRDFAQAGEVLRHIGAALRYRPKEREIKMTKEKIWALTTVLVSFLAWGCYQYAAKDTTPKMTKEELRPQLGDPNVVIIDVRLSEEWKKSESKIKGAVREDPEKAIKDWADKYPKDKTLVFY